MVYTWRITGSQNNAGQNDVYQVDVTVTTDIENFRFCCGTWNFTQSGISKAGYYICVDGKQTEGKTFTLTYKCYTKAGNFDMYPSMTGDYTTKVYQCYLKNQSDLVAGVVNPISDNPLAPHVVYTGTDRSDVGNHIYTKAREYFDTLIHGVGTATIDIPAGGVNLTFTSALQGISNDKFVTGDTEITITPTKKNVDITVNSVVGDVVTIRDRYGNTKATVNITAQ